tara:strand:- start:125 stop:925 length:801 start_codon:yes stop_codon:yes gene_type:complete
MDATKTKSAALALPVALPWGAEGAEVFATRQDATATAARFVARIVRLGGRSDAGTLTPVGKTQKVWSMIPRASIPGAVQAATRLALCHARHGMTASALPVYGDLDKPDALVVSKVDKHDAPVSPDGSSPTGWIPSAKVSSLASSIVESGVGVRVAGKTWSSAVKALCQWADAHADTGDDGKAVGGWALDAMRLADANALTTGGLARVKASARAGRTIETAAAKTSQVPTAYRNRVTARVTARDLRAADLGTENATRRAAKGSPRTM